MVSILLPTDLMIRAAGPSGLGKAPCSVGSADGTLQTPITQNVFHSRIYLTCKISRGPAAIGRNKVKGTTNRRGRSRSGTNVGSCVEV